MTTHNLHAYALLTTDQAAALVASGSECAPCQTLSGETYDMDSLVAAGESGEVVRWRGPIGFESVLTGDGRMIEPNALTWDAPMPLRWAPEDVGGHGGAQVVGLIESVTRDGNAIIGEGFIETGSDIGAEAARQVSEGLTVGISMDLDDVSFEIRVKADILEVDLGLVMEEDGDVKEGEPLAPDGDGYITVMEAGSDDEVFVTTSAGVRAATLVSIPAFEGAKIALVDAASDADETTAQDDADAADSDDEGSEDAPVAEADDKAEAPALVASGAPLNPPAAWFDAPDLDEPTPLVVSDTGRVFGHIATWGTCHTGYAGQCVTPPSSATNYAYFRTGATITAEGDEIATGPLTLDTGHAPDRMRAPATLAHYDNTGTAVADVVVGEDVHGIWVAGAVRPEVSAEKVRALRAAPLSGDWRRVGASMELMAVLGVNMPGFPVPRTSALVASGQMRTLVAAGMLAPREVIAPGSPDALSREDLRYLKSLARREKEREHAIATATPEARAEVDALARQIALDAFATSL